MEEGKALEEAITDALANTIKQQVTNETVMSLMNRKFYMISWL